MACVTSAGTHRDTPDRGSKCGALPTMTDELPTVTTAVRVNLEGAGRRGDPYPRLSTLLVLETLPLRTRGASPPLSYASSSSLASDRVTLGGRRTQEYSAKRACRDWWTFRERGGSARTYVCDHSRVHEIERAHPSTPPLHTHPHPQLVPNPCTPGHTTGQGGAGSPGHQGVGPGVHGQAGRHEVHRGGHQPRAHTSTGHNTTTTKAVICGRASIADGRSCHHCCLLASPAHSGSSGGGSNSSSLLRSRSLCTRPPGCHLLLAQLQQPGPKRVVSRNWAGKGGGGRRVGRIRQ
jgi:hypothetical protein